MKKKLISCKACGEEIAKNAKNCPHCGAKNKKPLHKKWWFWLIVIMLLSSCVNGGDDNEVEPTTATQPTTHFSTEPTTEPANEAFSIELIAGEPGEYGELFTINAGTDFEETYYIFRIPSGGYTVTNSGEYLSQITVCSDEVNVTDEGWEEPAEVFYVKALTPGESDTFTIENGQYIEIHEPAKFTLEICADAVVTEPTTANETVEPTESVPKEYQNALKKAESYANIMHMSKAAIYDQLVSEYGEQFPEDAAQYAIDNLDVDWNANALAKAEDYSETMYMSKAAIYDQLISEYGEQFTEEEAQYAIDNIEADWKENALEKAKTYQDIMSMSKDAIYDQLVSEYGEQFTAEEAQYAIDNLE